MYVSFKSGKIQWGKTLQRYKVHKMHKEIQQCLVPVHKYFDNPALPFIYHLRCYKITYWYKLQWNLSWKTTPLALKLWSLSRQVVFGDRLIEIEM